MRTHTRCRAALVALLFVMLGSSAEAIDRGVQFSPSGDQVLANKDVGTERWAITLNNDDGSVTGNVFRTDGPPAFVSCNPSGQPNGFACFGADACSEGGTQRGIQQTPDGKRVLVNKDVGTERWAIARNPDQTILGNVFRNDGDPSFIACNPLAQPNTFSCSGADACTVEPCTDDFSFINEVTLPESFFTVPTPCNEQFDFIGNVTLPEGFFQLTTADDFISELETGSGTPGQLQVGAAPIPGLGAPSTVSGVSGPSTVDPGGMSEVVVTLGGAAAAGTVSGSYLIVALADETCTPGNFVSGFYEIPLLTQSSQITLSLSFAESLSESFVLCITTLIDGIVGQYFDFQQTPTSACGNGVIDGGEACDPPAAQGQCPTGQLCSNDCSQCVAATSCAGRCCPGRDDNCTADAAPCFCDEFCVTAQDCCSDALEQCGFGSPNPVISNLTQTVLQVNSCDTGQVLGSRFRVELDFTDADGDVSQTGSALDLIFRFLPSGQDTPVSTDGVLIVSGNGSAGRLRFDPCYVFSNETSIDVTVTLRDDAGNASNTLSVNSPKPPGAN